MLIFAIIIISILAVIGGICLYVTWRAFKLVKECDKILDEIAGKRN